MINPELYQLNFQLSPLFTIPPVEEVIDIDAAQSLDESETLPEVKLLLNKEMFILSSERGRDYLINPTIKAFLLAFEKDNSLQKVIEYFAQLTNATEEQIKPTMTKFLHSMVKQEIIIPSEIAKDLMNKKENNFFDFRELEKGASFGDYEVISLVATHGPTQVYKCKFNNTNTEVIVKTIFYPEELPNKLKEYSTKKFIQEFELMAEFQGHPNICQLIELNTNGHAPFAAIEYIEGQSLREFIATEVTSIDEKINIIRQLLEAISYVQSKEIIHGDIHMSNFLIKENKQVKLIDFGLSNRAELEENEIMRNGGVHECIPPERIKISAFGFLKDKGNYSSEVFQLGVMIYCVLYKTYPFTGFTWDQLAQSILEKELELDPKTTDDQDIPPAVLTVLNKSLQKNPEDRFQTAKEMLDFLRENL